MRRFMKWFVANIIRPKWVVFNPEDVPDSNPELGLKIFGIIVGFYKARELYYTEYCNVRQPEKREFGECLHPMK